VRKEAEAPSSVLQLRFTALLSRMHDVLAGTPLKPVRCPHRLNLVHQPRLVPTVVSRKRARHRLKKHAKRIAVTLGS